MTRRSPQQARTRPMAASSHRDSVETGAQVYLRHPAMEDAAEYTALMRKSRSHLRPWAYPCETIEQYQGWLVRANPRTHQRFFVCQRDTDAIVGYVALNEIVYGLLCSAYIGYQIGLPYARQGYMTEALELVLRHSFRTLKLHRVEANIQPGNLASIAVARRVGFVREGYSPRYLKIGGRWCDHERWAILREDWEQRASHAVARTSRPEVPDPGTAPSPPSTAPLREKRVRVSAKAIIVRDAHLLALRCVDDHGDWFALPGGGQQYGENLPEAVRRECMEEVGAHVEVGPLAFVRDYVVANHEQTAFTRDTHQLELMFLCTVPPSYRATSGDGPDTTQVGVEWLPLHQLERFRLYPQALATELPALLERGGARALPMPVYLGDVN